MQVTFAELKSKLLEDTHPQALPDNLLGPYDRILREGLVTIQKWVECLQENNTQLYPFCATRWDCNATVVGAPKGRIKRVYTIQSDQHCDKVYYKQISYARLLCAAKAYGLNDAPDQSGLPAMEEPFKYASASTDRARGRARYGFFALDRGRLYAFPNLHSSETLVVEWDGIKREWADHDLVNGEPEVYRTLKLFLAKEMARDYDKEFNTYQTQAIEYQEALRDLIHECREETRVREFEGCDLPSCCSEETCRAIEAATAAPAATQVIFANIGDYGMPANGSALAEVAALVKSWEPAFIVTNGDNIYDSSDYDGIVGLHYGDYITADLQTNRFWPALGNHDYNDAGLSAYQAFFTLPNNERYYDFVRSGVHFFILNSSLDSVGAASPEPDGVTQGGAQGEWLRVNLAVSPARWKIVIVQDPPYTDQATDFPGHTVLRWPFQAWGASAVISGDTHAYERYLVGGFPYIVNGAGGASRETAFQATPNALDGLRQIKYNGSYGAIKGTITCEALTLEFFTTTGTLVDTITLT